MIKEKFDKLIGIATDLECYSRIEYVYMNSNFLNSAESIADFYNHYGMTGIEKMYCEIYKYKNLHKSFDELLDKYENLKITNYNLVTDIEIKENTLQSIQSLLINK